MAQSRTAVDVIADEVIAASPVLAAPMPPLDKPSPIMDTPPMPDHCGQMTITLIPNGTSSPHPRVSFSPVGMFTQGLIERHLGFFSLEIARAQAAVRHEQATATHNSQKEPA